MRCELESVKTLVSLLPTLKLSHFKKDQQMVLLEALPDSLRFTALNAGKTVRVVLTFKSGIFRSYVFEQGDYAAANVVLLDHNQQPQELLQQEVEAVGGPPVGAAAAAAPHLQQQQQNQNFRVSAHPLLFLRLDALINALSTFGMQAHLKFHLNMLEQRLEIKLIGDNGGSEVKLKGHAFAREDMAIYDQIHNLFDSMRKTNRIEAFSVKQGSVDFLCQACSGDGDVDQKDLTKTVIIKRVLNRRAEDTG
ncbi:unnamed protein product, partial [Amoebophrya sp. A120]|eukprot:GSA120T00010914001.1